MVKSTSDEELRAKLIIKYRKFKVEGEERAENKISYTLSRGDEKYILQIILGERTIGIAFIRELKTLVDEAEADGGIIVGNGSYTYSAKSNSPKLGIELIPSSLPSFDLFDHDLVPAVEIVSEEEKKSLIEQYHAKLYQFPWMKSSDPVSIILGARRGDVVRVISDSETAGKYESYRYVV